MGLVRRGKRIYFYQSSRESGRVRCVYVASGHAAVAEAQAIEAGRAGRREALEARRRAARSMITRLRKVERAVSELSARVDGLFHEAMTACGYYRHHRQWRRRGPNMSIPLPGSKALDDAIAAERVCRLFAAAADVPALIEALGGGLGKRVRERLVKRLTDDLTAQEVFRREAEVMRRGLEGPSPTAIERLVVERVVVSWLSLAWADLLCDGFGNDLGELVIGGYCIRMRNAAQRNYLAALRSLAAIRKAAPAVTVNVNATVKVKKKGRGAGAGSAGGRLGRLGAGVN